MDTIMSKYDTYIEYWKQHIDDNEQDVETLSKLKKLAKECAKILVEKYGAKKVFLIGSVAREMGVHEDSDIDLVAEGLPPELYFKALVILDWEVLRGTEINLIPYEDAYKSMLSRVDREGKLLYARE